MNKLLTVSIATVLASGLSFAAFAQGNHDLELRTTHAHALMAANADTVQIGRAHLHHVINCLVGPKGVGFDASAGTPCKGLGNGAIPDAKGNAKLQGELKQALADAQAGLKAIGLEALHADAGKAAATLQGTSAPAASK